ncbi:hypothetical protein [Shinella sp.]|uniref:hypothetical protein n=1 Tax=Shinella sp. TaxID=1870904 RepID=UPI0028B0A089|nr:hypothetical protein [Shinella sp.]
MFARYGSLYIALYLAERCRSRADADEAGLPRCHLKHEDLTLMFAAGILGLGIAVLVGFAAGWTF